MSAPTSRILVKQIQRTSSHNCNGAILFFHGSGDTGNGIKCWLKDVLGREFSFPHLDVYFPTAPARPYTPSGGALSNVWFDRAGIAQNLPECLSDMTSMCQQLEPIVNDIIEKGTPKNKIIIGGFSMGGCMAMHMAYRFHKDIAGCFVLSGFLNDGSIVYDAVKRSNDKVPPLFYCHGQEDILVPCEWGEKTCNQLKSLDVQTDFHTFNQVDHSLDTKEVHMLRDWITRLIPENVS